MRSKLTKFLALFPLVLSSVAPLNAQNCIPTDINGAVINLSCPLTCKDLNFQIPHIKSSTDYHVNSIPYNPYPYVTAGGVELTSIYSDDKFSQQINLPFSFCFYGSNESSLVVGSNGVLSFDVSNANLENSWSLTTVPHGVIPQPIPYAGGNQDDIQFTYYPRASIMGAYTDVFPPLTAGDTRKVEYSIVGTAPCRKFIVSFYNVPMYFSSCNGLWCSQQIVLHESTGIVDIYIGNKPVCTDWNEGLAILGMQNRARDRAVTAPGKNCTVWNEHETAYRFVPSAGGSRYIKSELLTMAGTLVATADTMTTTPGLLDLNFPNICPPLGSTEYQIRTTFSACDNPITQLVSYDTITLTRSNMLNATAVTTNTDCGPPNGTITIAIPPGVGTAPFTYELDGITTVVGPNPYTLTGVSQGPHTIIVTDASGSCTSTLNETVLRNNSLTAITVPTATSCAAVANGSITVTATNGTGPYVFKLDGFAGVPGPNPFTFTNVNSGLHNIVVFDVTNCQTNVIEVDVPAGAGVDGISGFIQPSCVGVANGSITVNATAGVAPFTWQLDGGTVLSGASPFTFPNVLSGLHNVTIRDIMGCSKLIVVDVTPGPGVNGNTSSMPASCQGVTNGTITAKATLGTAPFSFQLDGGPVQTNGTDTYTFTGVSAAPHTVLITDNMGCTKSLDLTVGSGPALEATHITTATNCDGAANGTITITPTNGAGPYHFSLDGAPPVTGAVPYTFINVSAGIHNVVVSDGPGCISNPLTITVLPGPGLTTTVSKTNALCNSSATGSITVAQPALGEAPFEYSLDGAIWQSSNIFSGLMANTYTVYYRSGNGCEGSQPVTITEPTALSIATSIIPVICHGENNGTLTVNSGGGVGPYQFSINGGVNWQSSNVFNVIAGNYTISIRDANNCIITKQETVTQPAILTAASTNTNASCDGGNDGRITVNAGGGNAGYIYSTDGITFQTSNVFNVAPGTYDITVKDMFGCTTSFQATVGLTVNLFLAKLADATICDGTSTQLDAVSNATLYTWTPSTALSSATISNPIANPGVTTEYIVRAILGRCTTYDTVIVQVNAAPIPAAGPDGDICYGQNFTLQGSGGVQYRWSPAIYLDDPSAINPVSTPSKTTIYTLSVTDAIGCHSLVTDEVKVVVSKPMRINTYPFDTIAHAGTQFRLLATSEGISYTWSPATGLSNPDIANPIVTVGSVGDEISYKVVGVTEEGCKGEGYVKIRVYKGPEIYVPTGFTPNGDGRNDRFTPVPVGIKSFQYFRVFNRWGQLIFSTSKLNDGWDGRLAGKEQPAGVYVWVIEGISEDNKIITKKGTITLIR